MVHLTKVEMPNRAAVIISGTFTNTLASDVHCSSNAWVLIGAGQTLPATSDSTCDATGGAVGPGPVVIAPGTSTSFILSFFSLQGIHGRYQLRFDNGGSYEYHDVDVNDGGVAAGENGGVRPTPEATPASVEAAGDPDVIAKSLDPSYKGGAVWEPDHVGSGILLRRSFKAPKNCKFLRGAQIVSWYQCGKYEVGRYN